MKTTVTLTIETVPHRLVRDDEAEPGVVHYWFERREADRNGGARWIDLHDQPIKTTGTNADVPKGIRATVLAAFLERLTGNR